MSDAATTEIPVTLVVKSVYERNLSLELKMAGSSTILQVKECLQSQLPSAAMPKHQRLIFGGKICDDVQTLAQVLKRMDPNETYTFHLLVSPPTKPAATPASRPAAAPLQATPAPQSAAAVFPPIPAASNPVPPQATQPHYPATPSPSISSPPPTATAPCATPPISPLQTMHLQHYLAQQELMLTMQIQYLRHIQQFQQMHGIYFNPDAPATYAATPPPPVQFPAFHFAALRVPVATTPVGGADADPAAASPRFQSLRAVFGLLDFTLALKMCVMVYIIGQDLPPPRSYVLIGLAFVMYLFMTGILLKIYDIIKGNPHIDRAPPAGDNNGDLFNQLNDDANANGPPGPPLVTIATGGGVVTDIQSFAVGLVLSLFPSWRPLASATAAPANDVANNAAAADLPAAVDAQG